jgi:phosphate transport system substrate-binding protein
MAAPFGILHDDRDGHWISYTFHSYFEHMVGRRRTKALAINGVKPTAETIRSGEYPLCTDVYAVIRTPRNDEDTPARRLRDWLVSDEGQAVIEKTGYISWRQARGEFTGPQFERWGFPMTNGSTSALPPAKVVRAESLKLPWAVRVYASHGLGGIPADAIVPFEPPRRYYRRAMELAGRGDHHGTHTSWERLLETNPAPLTYVCRLPSDDEMRGNSAEEYEAKPVAKDAFVFIMNEEAPIDVLSLDQIRDIFSGRATNWAEVGGPDAVIRPITRNANSGSQETMESLVMRGPTIRSRANEAASMMGPFGELHEDTHAIGYTFWSYHHLMVPDRGVKMLAVDGVYPTHDTIADGSYPLVTDMYAVIRAGSSPRSWDRVLRDWLLTEEGQRVIERSGYVSLRQAEGDGG